MRYLMILLLTFLVTACQSNTVQQDAPPTPSQSGTPVVSGTPATAKKVEKFVYRLPEGDAEYTIKIKTPKEKYKLYDSEDYDLAEIKVKEDRVKVFESSGTELFKIKSKEKQGVEIEDASGTRLYRIKRQDDGDWKLLDAGDNELFKIKAKDDGFEIRRPSGSTVAKVKARDGQCNFKSEEGEELHRLSGVTNAQAAMWMALDEMHPAMRAGLVVFFLELR